jgi:5'-methylthioadenosine phosphorylase
MSGIRIGLIGGTGLGQALGGQAEGRRHDLTTPFGPPSDTILETEWSGLPLLLLSRHGPGHLLNPSQVPFRANIFALKQLGCTHLLASGAVGSLREEFRPRDLVIPDQIIDKTHARAGTFYERAAVHTEFAEPFCPVLRQTLIEAARDLPAQAASSEGAPAPAAFAVHDRGCYVCMEGPAFSTRAESLMHRLWGGDLIGMTAMPEAKLAREAEMSYALIALVTDYDCWRNQPPAGAAAAVDKAALLKEIIGNVQAATENAIQLMKRTVAILAERGEQLPDSPARHALELAIWSDKAGVAPEEVQRLAPLWIRCFG